MKRMLTAVTVLFSLVQLIQNAEAGKIETVVSDKVPSTASAEELPPPVDNEVVPSLTEGGNLPPAATPDATGAPPTAPVESTPSMLGSPTLPHEDVEPGFPPPQKLNAEQAPADSSNPPSNISEPQATTAPSISSSASKALPVSLALFLGADSVKMADVNQRLGSSVFQTASYFGGEFAFPMTDSVQGLFRIEEISKDETDGTNDLNLKSMPVSVGLSLRLADLGPLEIHAALLLGVAFNTQMTETVNSGSNTGSVSLFSTTSLMEMAKVDASFRLTHSFQLYGEAGYRFLKTSSLGANPLGRGDLIFQSTIAPITLDLSGPMLAAGIRYAF